MMITKTACLLIVMSTLVSCSQERIDLSKNEPVLTDGLTITVSMPNEIIVIEGLKGSKRRYSGSGWSKASTLIPRTTRWYGSLGLYDPAESYSLSDRLLVDEGRQFFSSESETLRYIKKLSDRYKAIAFSSNGLLVAYDVAEIKGGTPTRWLEVWQIYINGVRPNSLKGADDSRIRVSGGTIQATAIPIDAVVGYERELANEEFSMPAK